MLTTAYAPLYIDVENESHRHHVPEHSETHFKITLVSTAFEGLSRIARHRKVNEVMADELKQGLHALSMFLYTPKEWAEAGNTVPASPACRDGFRHG